MGEFLAKDGFCTPEQSRNKALQNPLGFSHQRNDTLSDVPNIGQSSLKFKLDYLLRLLTWTNSERLISHSLILQWALTQLQVIISLLPF